MLLFWLLISGLILSVSAVLCYALRTMHTGYCASVTVVFALTVTGLYVYWGDSRGLQQWHELQEQQVLVQEFLAEHGDDPVVIIERLRSQLAEDPERAEGWYLLGRLYLQQGDYPAANAAFARAYALTPTDTKIIFAYAESGYWLQNASLTGQPQALLNELLAIDPNNPDALSFLAIAAYQQQEFDTAIDYWQRLLALNPPPDLKKVLLEAIAKAKAEQLQSQLPP